MSRLESKVEAVTTQVYGITYKLDLLNNAAYDTRMPLSHSSPDDTEGGRTPRREQRAARGGRAADRDMHTPLQLPRHLREQQNQDGYVDHYAQKDKFSYEPHQGKRLPTDIPPIPKPYMYIIRE